MKIILDFDDTIFNTSAFIEEKIKIFNKEGFFREEYFINYEKVIKEKGYFDADLMIDSFFKSKNFDKNKIKSEIEAIIKQSKVFVYEDFFDFAGSFDKKDMALLSAGLKEIQKGKIENAGIVSFFDYINIPEKYKSDEISLIAQKYPSEKIFFIDDKAKQVDKVKKELPQVIAMKMERASGRHILPKSELADYVVKDFGEAKKIINELNK